MIDILCPSRATRRLARDMEMHPETWFECAHKHPIHAKRSPLFGLMTLEHPARWRKMLVDHSTSWIARALDETGAIPQSVRYGLLAQYVERTVPVFLKMYPSSQLISRIVARLHTASKGDRTYLRETYAAEMLTDREEIVCVMGTVPKQIQNTIAEFFNELMQATTSAPPKLYLSSIATNARWLSAHGATNWTERYSDEILIQWSVLEPILEALLPP